MKKIIRIFVGVLIIVLGIATIVWEVNQDKTWFYLFGIAVIGAGLATLFGAKLRDVFTNVF